MASEHSEDRGAGAWARESGVVAQALEADFVDRCRLAREAAGLSQRELARRLTDAGMLMHQSSIAKLEIRGEGRRPLRLAEAALLSEVLRVPLWTTFANLGFDESVRAGALELRREDINRERDRLDAEERAVEAEIALIAVRDRMLGNPIEMEEALHLVYDLAHHSGIDPDRLLADVDALDPEHVALGEAAVGDAPAWYRRFLDIAQEAGYLDLESTLEATARRIGSRYVFPGAHRPPSNERRVPPRSRIGEASAARPEGGGELPEVVQGLIAQGYVVPMEGGAAADASPERSAVRRGDD